MLPASELIRMTNITKRFPRVVANDRVNLSVADGEIHALVGENGAGKSTLMNILYGLARPDEGEIRVGGCELPHVHGYLGLDYGIGMIHQHFMLIDRFTVLENIILGAEPRTGLMVDMRAARQQVTGLMSEYGIAIDLDRRIDELSVGEEQRVEILKVLYRNARIIIMDEPTAVLTPQETRGLFATLKMLTDNGRTVIFITHKLEEVMEVAAGVTVMRAGRVVSSMRTAETDVASLAEMMVGRKLEAMPEKRSEISPEPVLEVRDISLRSAKGLDLLTGVSFDVRRGEIFGICGVDGNGQDEIFEIIIGFNLPTHGSIRFLGKDITLLSTSERLKTGLAHIPPDRTRMGLVSGLSIAENLILGRHTGGRFAGHIFLRAGEVSKSASSLIDEFGIEPPVPEMDVGLLSGGNQQKVIAAREISRRPEILIASQPTRGLDVGAARLIHDLLLKQAEAGRSVLLISADLAEVMMLADRIGVMYRGSVVGIIGREEATEEDLGLMMAGVTA